MLNFIQSKISLFIIIFLISNQILYSQNVSKTGTTAASFLEIGIGGPANAMGGAFVGLANDAAGTNAMCYTKLTSTVVQGIEDTVVIYYSLTLSTY